MEVMKWLAVSEYEERQVKEGYMRSGKTNHNVAYADLAGHCQLTGYGDSGSASRFFYCAKASKSERNKWLEGFEEKKTNDGRNKEIDNAFQRGSTLRNNNHPTVKPIALNALSMQAYNSERRNYPRPIYGVRLNWNRC